MANTKAIQLTFVTFNTLPPLVELWPPCYLAKTGKNRSDYGRMISRVRGANDSFGERLIRKEWASIEAYISGSKVGKGLQKVVCLIHYIDLMLLDLSSLAEL